MKAIRKLLQGLLCFGLCACTETVKPEEKRIKIGISVYDSYDTFISEMISDFNAAVAGNELITVEINNAAKSQQTQNKQAEAMIDSGCDVICINLVDRTSPRKIIDLARKNNVPVIFFNRELVEEDLMQWEELYYIGADAEQSGIMEGEVAAEAYERENGDKNDDGIIQYVILEGEAGHQDAIVRTQKSVDTLIDKGFQVDKIASLTANWNRSQAQTRMSQLIETYGSEIEMVLGNNDDMALGAIDAYKAAGIERKDWPVIVGIDGIAAGLEAVRNGEMAGTVFNDQKGQANAMALLAITLASNGSLNSLGLTSGKYIRLPYQKVTSDNISDYLE